MSALIRHTAIGRNLHVAYCIECQWETGLRELAEAAKARDEHNRRHHG